MMSMNHPEWSTDFLEQLKGTPESPVWNLDPLVAVELIEKVNAGTLRNADILLIDWRDLASKSQMMGFFMKLGELATETFPDAEPVRVHNTSKGKVFMDYKIATFIPNTAQDKIVVVDIFEREVITPNERFAIGSLIRAASRQSTENV